MAEVAEERGAASRRDGRGSGAKSGEWGGFVPAEKAERRGFEVGRVRECRRLPR